MIDEGLKQQLLDSLQVAVKHVNGGDDANSAVAKAAAAADFNREQTCRLCELFNTARTLYHFEHNPDEKTASFPLVDKEAVLKSVFDDAVRKSASDIFTRPVIPDYSEYDRREEDMRLGKLASPEPLWDSPEPAVPDLDGQAIRLQKIVRTQLKMAEHADAEARCAVEHALQQTRRLADDLVYSYWNAGNTKYARLVRCYDDKPEYAPVLETLNSHMPDYMRLDMPTLQKMGNVVEDRDLDAEKAMVEDIKTALEGAAALAALGKQVEKEAKDASAEFAALVAPKPRQVVGEFDEFLTPNFKLAETSIQTKGTSPSVGQLLSGKPPSEVTTTKKITTFPDLAKGLQEGAQAAGVGMDTLLGTDTADFNKKITERLRNQQREVLMQDLIMNDPFISDADPQTVAALYAQIMQVAPEVSLNKEVVRGVLRQGLHNVTAVSPFDAQAWADLEKTIREVQGTLPARPGGEIPGGKKPGGK